VWMCIRKLTHWRRWSFLLGIVLALGLGMVALFNFLMRMPGKSFAGELPTLQSAEEELAAELRPDLEHLAGKIGERNVTRTPTKLEESAQWIEGQLLRAGYTPEAQEYEAHEVKVRNIIAEVPGNTAVEEILVIGAHYDSVVGCPGANDNGSGVVSLLALARRLAPSTGFVPSRTVRFVFFVNEEPPWFQGELMGSVVYARACKQRKDNIIGMLSLETMGYYSDEPHSQKFPTPLFDAVFPTTGNYIGFVSSSKSGALVRKAVGLFRQHTKFPSEGAAVPGVVPGIGWSDHWSFEIHGYPAVMVTDTAPFRYEHYHTAEDTPDKVQYENLARVTLGLEQVVRGLAAED